MSVSASIPATLQIRRSRLLGLIAVVAALAAAVTWALTAFAFDTGGTGTVSSSQGTSIRVGDAPLDEARVYRVAVNSFLWGGGDGYRVFSGPPAKDTGLRLRDAVMTHFGRAKTFRPDTTSRIVVSR